MKDYKLKQRNLRASHTLGFHLLSLFFLLLSFFHEPTYRKHPDGIVSANVREFEAALWHGDVNSIIYQDSGTDRHTVCVSDLILPLGIRSAIYLRTERR